MTSGRVLGQDKNLSCRLKFLEIRRPNFVQSNRIRTTTLNTSLNFCAHPKARNIRAFRWRKEKMSQKKNDGVDEPRDQFTLNVITWIQDLVRSSTTLDPQRQEEEYQKLLNQPLDNFEL